MKSENQIVKKAHKFAQIKHKNQLDDCGLPYFDAHVIQVVEILKKVTQNDDILAAAYLHDVIEDTDTTINELYEFFGSTIGDLVMEVTHEGEKDNYGRYFPRLKSQNGIMIKLADRLSNISRMEAWNDERKRHYLLKTKFWKDGTDKK